MGDVPTQHIEDEYQRAMRMHSQAREAELRVRELLELADERRQQEAHDIRKWNRILSRLEVALDATKARQAACEQELDRQRRRAERRGVDLPPMLFDLMQDNASSPCDELGLPGSLAKQGPDLSDEAISFAAQGLSDYAATLAYPSPSSEPVKKEHAFPAPEQDMATPASSTEIRISNISLRKSLETRTPQVNAEERRMRGRLRIAVDKMVMRHYDALSMSEIDLLLNSFAAVLDQSASDRPGERMSELFAEFMEHLQKRQNRWSQLIESRQNPAPPRPASLPLPEE